MFFLFVDLRNKCLVLSCLDIFKRKDAIIWQFYSHIFVSSYDFVEDFRKAATV